MKRFEKAKEIVQSDQFGNVIDFFQAVRENGNGNNVQASPQFIPIPQKKPDYTPLLILGAVAVIVALIKK
jgi:hypothetical protein